MPDALAFAWTCAGREAPMIAEASSGRRSTHASASSGSERPACSATGRRRSTARSGSSPRSGPMAKFIALLAARESAGGASPRPVLAGQQALGERRPDDLRDAVGLAQREELGLRRLPQHRVLRLGGDEEVGAGDVERRLDLLRRPLAEAEEARLAGGDDLLERLNRLLDRDARVEAMRLVEVDVVGLQPPEQGVDLLGDVGGREPAVVRVVGHLAPHLGGQHVSVARAAGEDLAPRGLGGAAAVDVGGGTGSLLGGAIRPDPGDPQPGPDEAAQAGPRAEARLGRAACTSVRSRTADR